MVENSHNKWTQNEIDRLIKLYNDGVKLKELDKYFNRSYSSIVTKLYFLGKENKIVRTDSLRRREYFFNFNYFEKIDSQEKAYWLGWLATDGHVRNANHTYYVELKLSEKDINVLFEFQKALDSNAEIRKVKKRNNLFIHNKVSGAKFDIKDNGQYSIRFNSQKMVYDLEKYEICAGKSYNLTFPDIDPEFYPGFIAGMFSGDGCVSIRKNRDRFLLVSYLASTLPVLQKTAEILHENIGYNINKKIRHKKDTRCLHLLELNQTETIKMYEWFKKNETGLMKRKNGIIEFYIQYKDDREKIKEYKQQSSYVL